MAPPSMSMSSIPGKAEPSCGGVSSAGNSPTSSVRLGAEPPSYPPSEVRHWMVCPTFWRDSRNWEPRADRWTPHALVGTAIHAGIATYLKGQGDHAALQATHEALADGFVEQESWSLLSLSKLVEKGYCALRDAIQERWGANLEPFYIEYPDPIQDPRISRGRKYRVVDFVRQHTLIDGYQPVLEVWDWKTKINLDDMYLGEALRSVTHSWQLLDYAWHVQHWAKAPVTQVGHGLVVLGPGKPKVHWPTVQVTPERLARWRLQAATVWWKMWQQETGKGSTTMNFEACSDRHLHFGKECFLMPGCHQLCGNQTLYPSLYRRKGETG